jgi:hypothetical protein
MIGLHGPSTHVPEDDEGAMGAGKAVSAALLQATKSVQGLFSGASTSEAPPPPEPPLQPAGDGSGRSLEEEPPAARRPRGRGRAGASMEEPSTARASAVSLRPQGSGGLLLPFSSEDLRCGSCVGAGAQGCRELKFRAV